MTLSIFYNSAAIILYVAAIGYLISLLIQQQTLAQPWLLSLAGCAIVFHGLGIYALIATPLGVNLAIHKMFSLVLFSVNAIVIISSLRKPLHNVFILLFPVSIIAIGVALFSRVDYTPSTLAVGISVHILLSLVAYSLLSIAVLQALLLHWQNHQLKTKHLSGFVRHLPPLQTMETLMFELLWAGVVLLGLGIIVGALYIENIFAQHLAHKTFLSIVALLIFAALLWGRAFHGWRGNQAIRWVLAGFCMLMLAYFGSKLVLEVFLV